MSFSACDRCGETISDIDAGFSPGVHEMAHGCGGTWRVVSLCDGSGPEWGDTPCGAAHVHDGATLADDIRSHGCAACGEYTAGADTHDGGLCLACSEPTHAVVAIEYTVVALTTCATDEEARRWHRETAEVGQALVYLDLAPDEHISIGDTVSVDEEGVAEVQSSNVDDPLPEYATPPFKPSHEWRDLAAQWDDGPGKVHEMSLRSACETAVHDPRDERQWLDAARLAVAYGEPVSTIAKCASCNYPIDAGYPRAQPGESRCEVCGAPMEPLHPTKHTEDK